MFSRVDQLKPSTSVACSSSFRPRCWPLQFTFLLDDIGIPKDYRHMDGFGVHTFKLINKAGKETLVKFHWKTKQGAHHTRVNLRRRGSRAQCYRHALLLNSLHIFGCVSTVTREKGWACCDLVN